MTKTVQLPVSVVIPAFNAAAYIAETIESVWQQTVNVAEIVVVDDGSSDRTVEIARECGAIVIEQRNAGVSAARNLGISRARSAWVALLDADDLWLPEKLAHQWRAINASPDVDFVFSDFSQFDEVRIRNRSVLHEIHRHFNDVRKTRVADRVYICDRGSLGHALLAQNVIQPSALLIRRELAITLGGFDLKLLACQDYDFVFRLSKEHTGGYVDLPLVRYRRHATATTSNIPKSREGLANVGLRVLLKPYDYSSETVTHFRRVLPSLFLKCGFAHLRYGSPMRAREWLRRSLRERFSFAALFLIGASLIFETGIGRRARALLFASTVSVER